jgi:plasmid stabilization system protein ParE
MKLRYERGALADLEEILAYIAGGQSEGGSSPRRSHRRHGAANRGESVHGRSNAASALSAISCRQHLIVYEVGIDEVFIHYVRHGARPRPWEGE